MLQGSTANETGIQEALNKKARARELIGSILPFSGLVFIALFFLIMTDGRMLRSSNLSNLLTQCFTVSLVAVGAAFVYAQGGLDFSIGASCGLSQLVCALLYVNGISLWLAIPACVLTAVLCALIVGTTSMALRVPVFVTSLCMRAICMGILAAGVAANTITLNFVKLNVYNNPNIKLVVLLAFFLLGFYMFEYTALGKNQKAIGGNSFTAFQAGVNIQKNTFLAYALLGICVGVAAFFQLTRSGVIAATSGSGLEFDILIAIVLGGFPLTGGSAAKLRSVIIGALTITVLSNGLVLWGLSFHLINGVKGLLFLIIVGLSYDRNSQKQFAMI